MSYRPIIAEAPTREAASSFVADMAANALGTAIAWHGRASLALSGGNTPVRCMEMLPERVIDWSAVHVGLVDDRFVPASDDGSNEALVRRTLLQGRGSSAKFLPMWQDGKTPETAAQLANNTYNSLVPFDFMLLGMGGDGHTASWFPHTKDLDVALTSEDRVIAIDSEGVAGARGFRRRLTLTKSAVAKTQCAALLLFGEDRRNIFLESLEMTPDERPIRAAVDALGDKLFVVWAA